MAEASAPYFGKVLVANRGEIACRVIRTLRDLGITSVAVYSEADKDAAHVRLADEAYLIGGPLSSESYLVPEKVLGAVKKSGAQAVHPGYGFLSENADFQRTCEAEGITFIGPDASAMDAMGYKVAAREKMIAAGVPVVPGVNAGSVEELQKAADEIGYPVMLKAAAGGGGKGMRLVHEPSELAGAYERAQSEARNSFGDDTVYLEKAIVNPRHIEIQVLADKHGNAVHFFERDCSIQRRNQKVVEETPSPFAKVDDAKVAAMGEVAVKGAKAVSYHSAGTVEFLMGEDGNFYFLEMNTRLQVEHPVTELTAGIDLVREMIRIAAGEPLGYEQSDIKRRGHAIQCRIYAEDPDKNFMPSPGHIDVLRQPSGSGVRDDSGAYQGCDIPSLYDPLISKLCVWAPTREEAVQRMHRALSEYVVTGIQTNIPFHLRLMKEPDFAAGHYDTGYIKKHEDAVLKPAPLDAQTLTELAVAAAAAQAIKDHEAMSRAAQSSGASAGGGVGMSAWRIGAIGRMN